MKVEQYQRGGQTVSAHRRTSPPAKTVRASPDRPGVWAWAEAQGDAQPPSRPSQPGPLERWRRRLVERAGGVLCPCGGMATTMTTEGPRCTGHAPDATRYGVHSADSPDAQWWVSGSAQAAVQDRQMASNERLAAMRGH